MKAAFLRAEYDVMFRDVDVEAPGPDEVTLRPLLVGICGTDIQYARGLATDYMRFGHEPVAEVVAVGANVDDLRPHDRVVGQCASACGVCDACLCGSVSECRDRARARFMGYFAELVTVKRRNVWKIDDALRLTGAVLLEPLGIALDIVRLAEIDFGDSVVVIGPGPIGLMAIRLARLRGARRIYAVGVGADRDRFPLCVDLGADECVDAAEADVVEWVRHRTQGRGVRSVISTATVHTVPDALRMCCFGGRVVFVGAMSDEHVPLDVNLIHQQRLDLRGSFAAPNNFLPLGEQLVLDGVFPVDQLVSHVFPFDRLAEALRAVGGREPGVVKVAVEVAQ